MPERTEAAKVASTQTSEGPSLGLANPSDGGPAKGDTVPGATRTESTRDPAPESHPAGPEQAAKVAYRVMCEDTVQGAFDSHEDAWFMAAGWNAAYPPPEFPEFVLDPEKCDDEECVCHD